MRVLIALGGNALLPRGTRPDARLQEERVAAVAPSLAAICAAHEVIVTHGNGPQVGLLATESADDRALERPYPLDALVAETQGLIGYWIQRSLASNGLGSPVVSLVTQTVVDADDPAFGRPSKFVGPVMSERAAAAAAAQRGWAVARDGDRWRRVVASPAPRRIVEARIVDGLVATGTTVVCAGGGGVPVVESGAGYCGVEAVVDKDLVASMLAVELAADLLVLVTDVTAVMHGFGTPGAAPIGEVAAEELAAGSFADGSMGPKVRAACDFVRSRGTRAAIGSLDDLRRLVAGRVGTQVRPAAALARGTVGV